MMIPFLKLFFVSDIADVKSESMDSFESGKWILFYA